MDHVPCATYLTNPFSSIIKSLTIFDDVENLTLHEFLRDFYTRKGLLDKLEDVDDLVGNYEHHLYLLYTELDKKYGTKFCANPPPVITDIRQAEPVTKLASASQSPVNNIVVLGNSKVGKTSLIARLQSTEFNEKLASTIGLEFLTHAVKVDNVDVEALIWDTAGLERFQVMPPTFDGKLTGALLVFDVGDRDSLMDVERWLYQLLNVAEPGLYVTLIGNKCDLAKEERAVTSEEARQFAAEHHMTYFETSAKTGKNVNDVFYNIIAATHRARLVGF